MRQRRIPHMKEKMEACREVLWDAAFLKDLEKGPLYLEIGCGKGKFLAEKAAAEPDARFLAAEGQPSVALRAMEKIREAGIGNARIMPAFFNGLPEPLEPGSVAGIYLNFSDPWPKKRHARRRLTHRRFLEGYRQLAAAGAALEIKTDSRSFFEFTLEEIRAAGLRVLEQSEDLHGSDLASRTPTTEYEEKFRAGGNPIFFVKALLKEGDSA